MEVPPAALVGDGMQYGIGEPRYRLARGREIELYSGLAFFGTSADADDAQTDVKVTYNSEGTWVSAEGFPTERSDRHHFKLYVPALRTTLDVLITEIGGPRTIGTVASTAFGADRVAGMDFQVANVPAFHGAHRFHAGEWTVDLAPVSDAADRQAELVRHGGTAVTAYGRLTSRAGMFDAHSGEELLHVLTWMLSFGFGDRVAVLLPVGTDDEDNVVWRQWADPLLESFKGRLHWLPVRRANLLADVFPKLVELWFGNSPWAGDGLWVPLQFYLESSRGLLEMRIVLAQTALEHLAWRRLVLAGDVARGEFEDLSAADRIRTLLEACQTPTGLTDELATALEGVPGTQNITDGPSAVAWVRNSIVHARRMDLLLQHDKDYGMPVLQQLQWYFDMAMLHLLDYAGPYLDRRRGGIWHDDVSLVPWSAEGPEQ